MGLVSTFIDLALFVTILYLLKQFIVARPSLPYPPGPRGLPLVRNLFDWPSSNECDTFTEWAHKYGDLVYANLAGTHIAVVNSVEVANKLLQGRGAIYSDRPSIHFHADLVGWGETPTMMEDGPVVKRFRRHFFQEFGGKNTLDRFTPTINTRVQELLKKVLNESEPGKNHRNHISTFATAVILEATYGYDVKGDQDELVILARQVMHDADQTGRPGAYLVDVIPQMDLLPSWFPGTGYRQEAAIYRRRFADFRNIPFEYTRENMEYNEASRSSFVGRHLQENVSREEEEEDKNTASMMYAGGADTTVSVIHSFFLFMTTHPEIQAKAQEEIDRVVGSERLPTVEDRPGLPYVEALLNEVLRFSSVLPQGVPHKVRASDVFEGYAIPEGTIIMPNIWFMSRDPRHYKNPEVFDPTRFLGSEPELDPRAYVFGFGRRICPGRVFADHSLYLTFVTILATMHMSKAKDAQGEEITPTIEYDRGGFVTHVKPFPFQVQARLDRTKLLESELQH